jgi:hypothetical protein
LVGGSNEPGKIARRIKAYAVKQKGNILHRKTPKTVARILLPAAFLRRQRFVYVPGYIQDQAAS